jgi:nicotinate phosphoribosyltransferase
MTPQHRLPAAMLTDLYQLTMAQAYLSAGISDTEGCFHLYFRSNPFGGGHTVACGLEQALEYLQGLRFTREDTEYLSRQTGADGAGLFTPEFLDWLAEMRFTGDVEAVEEGTLVFPREPLLRVSGPLPECQIVETALLNTINFQTLVATKASRCYIAAEGAPVIEFGLRRAQGPDGGLSASRAAYVGGCTSTSNVLAGQYHGVPIAGTHAHSWVMAFDTEREAFEAYARALPNNVTLLVDTYDTIEGVRHAVEVGRWLREQGRELLGVRIDSGDLAWLSKRAREILDEGGFPQAKVVASNELDEHLILSLKEQGAAVDAWGVGTKLATAWDQPALGGVYKLSAIRRPGSEWSPRLKVSEQTTKVTTPGVLGLRRYRDREGRWAGDMIYDTLADPGPASTMVHPEDPLRATTFSARTVFEELLVPVVRSGTRVYDPPPISSMRERALSQLDELDVSHKRFLNPHTYKVGVERGLSERRMALIAQARTIPEE